MTSPVGGIGPHRDAFTVGIVDSHGVETCHETFAHTAVGYLGAIDLLDAHGVDRVGVEGSAKWGAHVAIALAAAGFDAREVPPSRSAAQRRSRRLEGTDAVDAVASARALQAEPTLGPVQTLEVYDPLVAKIEAVLEHRRALVAARTLLLHHIGDQTAKLPTEIRDQVTSDGKIESRLRRVADIDPDIDTTPAGAYRLEWLQAFIDQDRTARREIRRPERLIDELLDEHGTTLRDETGIGPIAAATLLCEVGDPTDSTASPSSPAGAAPAPSPCHQAKAQATPSSTSSTSQCVEADFVSLIVAGFSQQRSQPDAAAYLARKATEGKTRREARRTHKRHLANRIIRRMWRDETTRQHTHTLAA